MAAMVYYIGPGFASWVASWSAYFFNFIVRISLLSPTYALAFLTLSWNLVLSLANMFFIFILIYAAFAIMLKAETARTMQTLAWVIAIALVVNFSFFFTRVVIDAGNILGVQFYNAVAFKPDGTPVAVLTTTGQNTPTTPDITAGLMNAMGVESLLGSKSFSNISQAVGSDWSTLIALTVVFLFAAVMWWVIAVALLMVGLKFFLRVIGLWLILIASPLAFVAQTVVNTRHFFQQWLRSLVGLSMYPAVFLFMWWILNNFATQLAGGFNLLGLSSATSAAQTAQGAVDNGSYSLLTLIANVSIRMMFIITLIYVMLKVSDWVIEQAGGMATTLVSRGAAVIAGGGFRTAASFGAFAGRNGAGRLGYNFANSQTGQNLLANSRFGIGSSLWRGANALSRGTFDIRNAPGAGRGGRTLGVLSRTSDVNTGRASQKNRAGTVDEQAKRVQAEGEALKASEKEILEKGKEQALKDQNARIDTFIDRKEKPNASNLRMPSWGALKGSSALRKSLEKARKEAKALERAAGESDKNKKEKTEEATPTPSTATAKTTPTSSGLVGATSDVAKNSISDGQRAARFAPLTPPTRPVTPAPAAASIRPSPQEQLASRSLFMQAQGEQVKKTAQAAAVAASLASDPNMGASNRAAADAARIAAPVSSPASTEYHINPGVAQAVEAVKGQGSMPERIEVRVPGTNTHTETVHEVTHVVHEKEPQVGTPEYIERAESLLKRLANRLNKSTEVNQENMENLQASISDTNAKINRLNLSDTNPGGDGPKDRGGPKGGVMPIPKAEPEQQVIPPKIVEEHPDQDKKAA